MKTSEIIVNCAVCLGSGYHTEHGDNVSYGPLGIVNKKKPCSSCGGKRWEQETIEGLRYTFFGGSFRDLADALAGILAMSDEEVLEMGKETFPDFEETLSKAKAFVQEELKATQ